MKQILLKKIAIIVAKLIRSRVLQVGWGFTGLQGAGWSKKIFPKDKTICDGCEDSIIWIRSAPLPSLLIRNFYIGFFICNSIHHTTRNNILIKLIVKLNF